MLAVEMGWCVSCDLIVSLGICLMCPRLHACWLSLHVSYQLSQESSAYMLTSASDVTSLDV